MSEPIEEAYFNWLCAKVMHVEVPTPSLTYYRLFQKLHSTEFVWHLIGDDNRAEDGLDLRSLFLTESGMEDDEQWRLLGCSILEMMIAFARRLEYETEFTPQQWFWTFIENLGLKRFNDAYQDRTNEIDEVLYSLVWRTYREDGSGGMFPLLQAEHDQRNVELWYQFCEYVVDHELD